MRNLVIVHDWNSIALSGSGGNLVLAVASSASLIGQYLVCFERGDECRPLGLCSGNFEMELNATASVAVHIAADNDGHLALAEATPAKISLSHFNSTLCSELSMQIQTKLAQLLTPAGQEVDVLLKNVLAVANSYFPVTEPLNLTHGHEAALTIAAAGGTQATPNYIIVQATSAVQVDNETSPAGHPDAFPIPTDGKAHIVSIATREARIQRDN